MTERGGGWVAAAVAVLLVPAYFWLGNLGTGGGFNFWVGFGIFTMVIGLAIWASVVAGGRLSRWWYVMGGLWGLVYWLYVFAAVAWAGF